MGLDPLTTKPEILVAMVIDWKVVSEGNGKLNSKYFKEIIEQNYEGDVRDIPLSRERLFEEATRTRAAGSILPARQACLLQAARPEFYNCIVSMK
jgi:hypothetical protein